MNVLYFFSFLSFFPPHALAKTSIIMFNRCSKRWYSCLIPYLRRKSFSSSSWSMILVVGFLLIPLSNWGNSIILLVYCVFISYKDVEFVKCYFCLLRWPRVFFLHSINIMCSIYRTLDVKQMLHSWDKSQLVTVYKTFLCCWIQFVSIY